MFRPIPIKKMGENNSHKVVYDASRFTEAGSRLNTSPAKNAPIVTEKPINPARVAIMNATTVTTSINSASFPSDLKKPVRYRSIFRTNITQKSVNKTNLTTKIAIFTKRSWKINASGVPT